MQGKTHFIGGVVGSAVGFLWLRENNMLIQGIDPALQALIMYKAGEYGGQFNDIDHHADAIPFHDPVSRILNHVLHIPNYIQKTGLFKRVVRTNSLFDRLFNALCVKHRSWQTHGLEVLLLLLWFTHGLMTRSVNSLSDNVLLLMLLGFNFGVISHFILDTLTSDGIVIVTFHFLKVIFPKTFYWLPHKFKFVPKTKRGYFATGSTWENIIREILRVVSYWLVIYIILGFFGVHINFV